MTEDNYHNSNDLDNKYMVLFFAGGETHDNKFNIFTGSFIRLMEEILMKSFWFIKGVYYKSPMMNVIYAANLFKEVQRAFIP